VRNPAFSQVARDENCELLELTQGARFGLIHQLFADERSVRACSQPRFVSLLLQGTAPPIGAARTIKNTQGAVLLLLQFSGKASMCQGINFLVSLWIVCLRGPSDPIVAARVKALQEDGRNAFRSSKSAGSARTEQGFGRLVRTKTDRGVLALLDSRFQRMAYGKIFLESLRNTRRRRN